MLRQLHAPFAGALCLLLCSPDLSAQALQLAGPMLRTTSVTYTRGPAGLNAGELLQKFAAGDLTGFGIDGAFPGFQVLRGVTMPMRDFGSSVPNSRFDVAVYTESTTQPGYPDLLQPLALVTGASVDPNMFASTTVLFPTPALAPIGRSIFVGIRLPATTSGLGGVRLTLISSSTAGSTFDLAGPGLPTTPVEENSYRLYRDLVTNTVTYSARGQYQMDLLTTSPSGMPAARTNQLSYPVSQIPPGSTTMLSGLHPDAASPPLQAGRADELAFVYGDYVLAPGSLVLFLGAFADFGPVVPLTQYAAGSLGGTCLDQPSTFVLGFVPHGTQGSQTWFVTTIPTVARTTLRGLAWTQQAIGFDAGNGSLRGSLCGKQRF